MIGDDGFLEVDEEGMGIGDGIEIAIGLNEEYSLVVDFGLPDLLDLGSIAGVEITFVFGVVFVEEELPDALDFPLIAILDTESVTYSRPCFR